MLDWQKRHKRLAGPTFPKRQVKHRPLHFSRYISCCYGFRPGVAVLAYYDRRPAPWLRIAPVTITVLFPSCNAVPISKCTIASVHCPRHLELYAVNKHVQVLEPWRTVKDSHEMLGFRYARHRYFCRLSCTAHCHKRCQVAGSCVACHILDHQRAESWLQGVYLAGIDDKGFGSADHNATEVTV